MRSLGSQRPPRSLRSLGSWSLGPRKDGETRSSSSPDLRESRKSQGANDPSPEVSLLVHCFRHLALQERHADRVQPYSAPPHHHHRTQATTSSMVPTWGQLKHLAQWAEEFIEKGRYEATPMIMFVAMLAALACQPRPSSAEKVHWAYLPNPPSFQPVDWIHILQVCYFHLDKPKGRQHMNYEFPLRPPPGMSNTICG